ncbi:MAG TPA: response regulator transcription factor [Ktedonobacteraceae bacterium]|nr:response regulator transcription factor [Ktedonobacteraceae bacterium]HEU5379709.1 response regulator transcription factor [Ktedonobacteraceae bacterium]
MKDIRRIRVMIVDDHPVVRRGLALSLLAFDDIEVVDEASNGEEALALSPDAHPDVVVMDLKMPGMGGVAAIRAIREYWPEVRVLALTSFQEGNLVQDALQAGAVGYHLKDITIDELAVAIRHTYAGKPTLSSGAAQALLQSISTKQEKIGQDLTEREREVLELLVKGLTNPQIAERLIVSEATVKFHLRSIRSKLGASSRTETVALALKYKLSEST